MKAMKTITMPLRILASIWLLSAIAAAVSSPAIPNIPLCGQTCVSDVYFNQTTCTATDTQCLAGVCNNYTLTEAIDNCIVQQCNPDDEVASELALINWCEAKSGVSTQSIDALYSSILGLLQTSTGVAQSTAATTLAAGQTNVAYSSSHGGAQPSQTGASSQSQSNSNPQSTSAHHGLSTGSKIGIGVGIPLGIIALASIFIAYFLGRLKSQRAAKNAAGTEAQNTTPQAPPQQQPPPTGQPMVAPSNEKVYMQPATQAVYPDQQPNPAAMPYAYSQIQQPPMYELTGTPSTMSPPVSSVSPAQSYGMPGAPSPAQSYGLPGQPGGPPGVAYEVPGTAPNPLYEAPGSNVHMHPPSAELPGQRQ